MAYPKFTVVTPTYNQGQFIEKTIDSVLSQGYPNLEFIIVDGGSEDNTVEIIKKYERHLAYWVSEPDRGQSHAINKGMSRATGMYVTWLNSDDWYVDDALYQFAKLFRENPTCSVVVGRGQIMDTGGEVISDKTPDHDITFEWICQWLTGKYFMQPSCAFTRDAWLSAGGLRESIHMAMDLDLWLRFAKAGCKFATTDKLLSISLSHPGAKTTAFVNESLLDAARVISAHGDAQGYEVLVARLLQTEKMLRHRLGWYEKNYRLISQSRTLKMIYPLLKRLSPADQYWQREVPPWKES
jgi:glycosyltransferase involved in cell wall biosynthesis